MNYLRSFTFFIIALLSGISLADSPSLYKVNSGDVLIIDVWNEAELSREVLVRPDGYINMPIIGDLLAGGRSIPDLEASMAEGLKKYLRDEPTVTISVSAINGNTIYVLGKVNRPGQFVMMTATDVTQALALAGGLTTFADKNSIKILRRNEAGEQTALEFNFSKIQEGKNLEQNIVLKSGDVVLVP